jgi:hypothetical protein
MSAGLCGDGVVTGSAKFDNHYTIVQGSGMVVNRAAADAKRRFNFIMVLYVDLLKVCVVSVVYCEGTMQLI